MRIVLLGGGLSHIQAVRHKTKNLNFNVEIVLVNQHPHVFYAPAFEEVLTGRLPLADAMIDLRKICTLAGVTFIQSQVTGIDTEQKLLKFSDRANLQYDFLSIDDIGEPQTHHPKGFLDNGFYTKELVSFFQKLQDLEKGLAKIRPHRFRVAVVGGGEAAVVLSRYLPERLKKYCADVQWEIFEKQEALLPHYQPLLRKTLEKELKKQDVLIRTSFVVGDVIESTLVNVLEPRQTFVADIIFFTTPSILPQWVKSSGLPLTSDGFLDAHPHFVLKNHPDILASGEAIGQTTTERDVDDHATAIAALFNNESVQVKRDIPKINKKEVIYIDGKAVQTRWGFVTQSEKTYLDHQSALKKNLADLRAVKEQKQARVYTVIEDNYFVEALKKRLSLDLSEQEMHQIFAETLNTTFSVSGWFEKEYKDVFNDHYLSSYHSCLDLIDECYLRNGTPQYLRLYVSAPSSIKDVEILSQIVIGASRAGKDRLHVKIHLCSQEMNTVQFSLGAQGPLSKMAVPQPMAYMALLRPLGLYALLSHQGRSMWQGEWMDELWAPLEKTVQSTVQKISSLAPQGSLMPLSEWGLINDLVRHISPEGWKICINLSQLPRWTGVNEILKEKPMDALIERNWQRGFRYWSGRGEAFPESQYLLWEPQLIRGGACLLIPPEDLEKIAETMGSSLYLIGYVEQMIQKEQTSYKLSDWTYESRKPSKFIEAYKDI